MLRDPSYQQFNDKQDVAFFQFLTTYRVDGVAAEVYTYQHIGLGTSVIGHDKVNQVKREDLANSIPRKSGDGWHLTYEEIRRLVDAGFGEVLIILANSTASVETARNGT